MRVILLILLCSSFSFAQIGEVKTGRDGVLIGTGNGKEDGLPEFRRFNVSGKDYYVLTFRNWEYDTFIDIQSFGFFATPEELEYLYNFIKDGIKTEEDRRLEVGDATLSTYRHLSRQVTVLVSQPAKPSGFFYLNQKWLDRLFGKR